MPKNSCRKQIGNGLKVRFPDGRVVLAWQLLDASRHSADPSAIYLPTETQRIERLYERHVPEVSASTRLRRALRMALKLADFEIIGPEGDASDLRILMLANGLSPDDFSIALHLGEPMVALNSEVLRRLGAGPGDSQAVH